MPNLILLASALILSKDSLELRTWDLTRSFVSVQNAAVRDSIRSHRILGQITRPMDFGSLRRIPANRSQQLVVDTTARAPHWRRVAMGAGIGLAVGAAAGAIIGHNQDRKCTGEFCHGVAIGAVEYGLLGAVLGAIVGDAWPVRERHGLEHLSISSRAKSIRLSLGLR